MGDMASAMTFRIIWCRRQRVRASSPLEREAWRAEEGLRDAVLHRDHVHKYRSHSPKVLGRYLLGFQDAKALIRTARVARLVRLLAIERNARSVQTGSRLIARFLIPQTTSRMTQACPNDQPLWTDPIACHRLEMVLGA